MNYKHVLSVSILLIALSIAYSLVIYLPNKEKAKELSNLTQKEIETKSNKLRIKQLDYCLLEAEDNYNSSWISYCKGLGMIDKNFFQSLSVIETDPNREWQTMSNGKSYSMDGEWVFDVNRDEWIPNIEIARNCKLANATVSIVEKRYKEEKDFCFQRYPQE